MRTTKKLLLTFTSIMIMFMNISQVPSYADENASSGETEPYALGCIEDDENIIIDHLAACGATSEDIATLASSVDLSSKYPAPGDQGSQGSCTAFAVAYAASSYLQNQEFDWGVSSNATKFSPAYVYNQINGGIDKGSAISSAIQLIIDEGVCSLSDMPYNQNNYTSQPNAYQESKAENFKFASYVVHEGTNSIKYDLANGKPVIISISVYPDFDNISSSNMVYDNLSGSSRGRHALCLVGYDDSIQAFKFINSWGTNWGLGGYGYISYSLFENSNVCNNRAYVITDAVQHYKSTVYGIETTQTLGVFSDSGLTNQTGVLSSGSKVGVNTIISASNGNPPVLKTRDGKYITALTDKTTKLNIFRVRYVANGGSGSMNDTIVPMGVVTNTAANAFSRTGYTFNGWYARRASDNKWLYKNTADGTTAWYVQGSQPSGYVKYLYLDKSRIAYTSPVNNDTVTFYAYWN